LEVAFKSEPDVFTIDRVAAKLLTSGERDASGSVQQQQPVSQKHAPFPGKPNGLFGAYWAMPFWKPRVIYLDS